MSSSDVLLPLIAPYAPAAPIPTIRQHLRLAAVEFCERARVWRDVMRADVPIQPNYQLYDPNFAVIHVIEAAWFDDEALEPMGFAGFSPADLEKEGPPKYVTQVDPETIAIVPRAAGTLSVTVLLKPPAVGGTFDEALPGIFEYQYGPALAAGTLASLLALPNQTWTNPAEADRQAAKFEREIRRNANANAYGQQRVRQRVRPQQF